MLSDPTESRAQLILDVAKAASRHLDLSNVLWALAAGLKPIIRLDAVTVVIIENGYARLHEIYHEDRKPGESWQSFTTRLLSSRIPDPESFDPFRPRPLQEMHVSAVASSLKPYVCNDVRREKRFPFDEMMLQFGIASYAS